MPSPRKEDWFELLLPEDSCYKRIEPFCPSLKRVFPGIYEVEFQNNNRAFYMHRSSGRIMFSDAVMSLEWGNEILYKDTPPEVVTEVRLKMVDDILEGFPDVAVAFVYDIKGSGRAYSANCLDFRPLVTMSIVPAYRLESELSEIQARCD